MKFGIVTPVYDKCLESTQLLYEDLKEQTHQDWNWFVCSNGFLKVFYDFVNNKNKDEKNNRLTYISTKYVELDNNCFGTIANIGKRRRQCVKKIDCDYLFLFDADAKILDKKMFETINQELVRKPKKLCVYYIKLNLGNLPIFPIDDGKIDLLNFCIKADIAKQVGYPTTVDFFIPANDYKFFVKCYKACKGDAIILKKVFCEYNGNNRYKNAQNKINETKNKNHSYTKQYLNYSLKCHPFGILKAIRDFPFANNLLPYSAVFVRDVYVKC